MQFEALNGKTDPSWGLPKLGDGVRWLKNKASRWEKCTSGDGFDNYIYNILLDLDENWKT